MLLGGCIAGSIVKVLDKVLNGQKICFPPTREQSTVKGAGFNPTPTRPQQRLTPPRDDRFCLPDYCIRLAGIGRIDGFVKLLD